MAAEGRAGDPGVTGLAGKYADVESELHETPCSFQFFQAVRLCELLFPERKPVGYFEHPSSEAARFTSHPTLSFPASQIQSISWPDGNAPKLAVNFIGLTGALGVLPLYYTELILQRVRAGDTGIADFLDIFNHRIISLFYRAWERSKLTIAYERGGDDRYTQYLKDLIGIGTADLSNRQNLPDEALIYYAGLLAQRPRSAAALRQILTDYFDVPVAIEQFAGAWYRLDEENQCQFDDDPRMSAQLGVGSVVGDEVWTQESRVQIKIGPLPLDRYVDFLPEGSAFEPLKALTTFFSNGDVDFEIRLILKHDEVPRCELGATGQTAPRLGWVSWARTAASEADAEDTVLEL